MKLYTNHMRYFFFLLLIVFVSCRTNYKAFVSNYRFQTKTTIPDYNNLDYWAAHPWKHDPSDTIAAFLKDEKRDSLADVFFIHPTTYTETKVGNNADVNNAALNAKTDYSTILYQASVFNQQARIFAPRYRQVHLSEFYVSEKESKSAFDTAYADVKRAFEFYLDHYHHNRPIIIAGHSQGALIAEWLLRDYFDGKPLQQYLVAAYVVGWPVRQNYFANIGVCSSPTQTDCFCSWRTFQKDYVPDYIVKEKPQAVVTNPLSWQTTTTYVANRQNHGGVLRSFKELAPGIADAQIHDGVLWINRPKFRGSVFFRAKNYHIADINLFYMNIRENVAQRIAAYLKK